MEAAKLKEEKDPAKKLEEDIEIKNERSLTEYRNLGTVRNI